MERERRVQTICLLALTAVAVGAALRWLQPMMVPFVLALFLDIALTPVVAFLGRRLRLPRVLALGVTAVLGLALLALVGFLVTTSVARVQANASRYEAQLQRLEDALVEALPGEGSLRQEALEFLPADAVESVVRATANGLLEVASQGFLVLLFLLFLMLGKGGSGAGTGVRAEVGQRVQGYVATKVLTSLLTGALVGGVLALLGVELALVFGVFAFLLNFVPSIGSVVATLLPLPVVFLNAELSTTVAVLAIALPGLIQFVVGNVLEPRLMGSSLDLHPVTILLALIFWGALWGFVGALLAAPITAVVKILLERGELTRPVAELFAGRLPGSAPSRASP